MRFTSVLLASLFAFASLVSAEPLKVGVALPLTGMAATYGKALQQGIELYLEDHPENRSSLQFIYEDHAYDGAKTVTAVRKLNSVDHVSHILVWGITPSGVAAPLAGPKMAPMLLVTSEDLAKGKPQLAVLRLMLGDLITQMVDTVQKEKFQHPAFVGTNLGAVLDCQRMLKEAGIKFAHEEIVPGDSTDFRSLISKLKAKQVDGMILAVNPEQMVPFARQSADQKFRSHVLSGDLLANDQTRAQVKELLGPVTYYYGATTTDFKNAYGKRYGDTSNLFEAATGYVFAQLSELLIKSDKHPLSPEFFQKLVHFNLEDSAMGPLKFTATSERGISSELPLVAYEDR